MSLRKNQNFKGKVEELTQETGQGTGEVNDREEEQCEVENREEEREERSKTTTKHPQNIPKTTLNRVDSVETNLISNTEHILHSVFA